MSQMLISNKKALIIDDFDTVRRSIKGMLSEVGFREVFEAPNGTYASKILESSKVDLILCDYNLGQSRNGLRLLEEWRLSKLISQQTLFVLITGDTSRQVVISALEMQPDDYLAKPFTMDTLLVRCERWFERRQLLLPILVSIEKEDWSAVAKLSRDIMDSEPRYRSLGQKQYVEALIKQEMFTEAENFLQGLLQKRYQGWADLLLQRILLINKDYQNAEQGLKKIVASQSSLIEAHDYLADCYESQAMYKEMQDVLDQAVNRAPHNIDRHFRLVQTAQTNLDYSRASQAFRDLINQASDTMHESIQIYQSYMKNLLQESTQLLEDESGRDIQKEIQRISKRMKSRFGGDVNSSLFNKALPVHSSVEPKSLKFTAVLNELFGQACEDIAQVNIETALFAVEVFYKAERFSDGDELIGRFLKVFAADESAKQRLRALQEQPVSSKVKEQAHQLNLKGGDFYRQKDYKQAINCFSQAMALSPRHPGVNLNFVQAHVLQMKSEGDNAHHITDCLEVLKRLEYLPSDHQEFKRYKKLLANLESKNIGK